MGLFFLGIQTPFYSTSTKAPTYMIHFQVFFTVTKVRFTWSQDLVLSHVYLSFVFDLVATQSKSLFPSFGLWCFPFTFSFPIFPFSFQRESNQENISFSRSIESFTSKIKLIVGPKIWLFILTHLYYYSFLDFIASLSLILDLFSLHIKRKKKGLFLNSQ